ncbi:MAG TPA: DUF3606 domain-containing protein [Alphaproteobacteria bacterium]|jgi:hypothetical protein|nr:DUF3606 domain-containing protein [Alphaproteobacteria bacterium]
MRSFSDVIKLRRSAKAGPISPFRFADKQDLPRTERVNVRDEAALRYWCARLDVTPERLTTAVIVVGDRLSDVQHQLGLQQP